MGREQGESASSYVAMNPAAGPGRERADGRTKVGGASGRGQMGRTRWEKPGGKSQNETFDGAIVGAIEL